MLYKLNKDNDFQKEFRSIDLLLRCILSILHQATTASPEAKTITPMKFSWIWPGWDKRHD